MVTRLIFNNLRTPPESHAYATSFSFSNNIAYNGNYGISVKTQPGGQTCTVSNGSGSSVISTITGISITCQTTSGVSTYAGNGSQGVKDGASTSATFFAPYGVAVDSSGNVYVADTYNYEIRKISTVGVVTTIMSQATYTAVWAWSITVDSSGNVYVPDSQTNKIFKINTSGQISTLAGSGARGSANGAAALASFDGPTGIAVDVLGNVYVSDTNNRLIRKIDTSGIVSTFAGTGIQGNANGPASAATFISPSGLVFDSDGNLYVIDHNAGQIRKINTSGIVSTFAGTGQGSADGTGALASFNWPDGIAIDSSNNIYVADSGNNKIRKISPVGLVSTFAGTGIQGVHNDQNSYATFNLPSGVAVDSNGNVYVADTSNNLIRKITP